MPYQEAKGIFLQYFISSILKWHVPKLFLSDEGYVKEHNAIISKSPMTYPRAPFVVRQRGVGSKGVGVGKHDSSGSSLMTTVPVLVGLRGPHNAVWEGHVSSPTAHQREAELTLAAIWGVYLYMYVCTVCK